MMFSTGEDSQAAPPVLHTKKVRHKRRVLTTHRSKVIEVGERTKKFNGYKVKNQIGIKSENKNKVKSCRLSRSIQRFSSDHPSRRHTRKHVLISSSILVELCHLGELGAGRFWWSGGKLRPGLIVQSAGSRKGLGDLHSTSRQGTSGASGPAEGNCQGNEGDNGSAGADGDASLCADRKATVRW